MIEIVKVVLPSLVNTVNVWLGQQVNSLYQKRVTIPYIKGLRFLISKKGYDLLLIKESIQPIQLVSNWKLNVSNRFSVTTH